MIPLYYSSGALAIGGISSEATSYGQGTQFTCSLGAFINYGATTFDGQVKLVLCDKNGAWKEELWTKSLSLDPYYYDYWQNQTCTITQSLNEGDRLRVYYKGQYSDEWQWVRSDDIYNVKDDVLVMASAEDMAKGLALQYNKSEHTLAISNQHAMRVQFYENDKNNYLGYADCTAGIGMSIKLGPGTYIIEASLGSDPYSLVIKL